jgi:hypothetical protein
VIPILPPGEAPFFYIDSDDLPPPPSRPWYRRPAGRWFGVDSRTFRDDDPNGLRAAPMAAVASAFLDACDELKASPRRTTREAMTLFRRWLEEDQGRRLDLATAIGLKRSGASLSDIDARSEIWVLIVALSRQSPWVTMRPGLAAEDLRRRFDRWEADVWRHYSDRRTEPTLAEPGLTFWRVKRFGLHRSLPNEQTLAKMIASDRDR